MNASFDTAGGDIVRVELLQHQEAIEKQWYEPFIAWFGAAKAPLAEEGRDPVRPLGLALLRRADRLVAVAGRAGPVPRAPHADDAGAWRARAEGRRERAAGASSSRPSAAASSWSRPTPSRAATTRSTCATRSSTSRARRSARSSTCSSCATATRRRAARASTSPSPARRSTPTPTSYKKIDFSDIEKREGDKVERISATNGWIAMVQHYFLVGLAGRHARRHSAAAPVLHRQARQQHLLGRHARSRRDDRAGREQDGRRPPLRRPAGREDARRRSRPASSWSRTTAGSRSSPSRCSGC